MKYKLKLINTPNVDQKKHKNCEKLNNITNNSTNSITNSSNNNKIKYNINLKKMQNKQKNFKNNILQYIKRLKSGKKIGENIKNSDSNIKNEKLEYIKSNKNLTISPNVKNKSHIPYRTLNCSNFHINKNKLKNLISQEKKLRIKNNSNSYSNNTSRTKTNSNYTPKNNFFHNSRVSGKNNNFVFDKNIKSNKLLIEIPKNNINKLSALFSNNNKILTISNRNHNYILNNPNLFLAETEILKSERNIMKKRSQKKDAIKNFINQIIPRSPSNSKSKRVFGRNSNRLIFNNNKPNLKSMTTQNANNKLYFSNKNINTNIYKSPKKIMINEYNFKTNARNIKYKK